MKRSWQSAWVLAVLTASLTLNLAAAPSGQVDFGKLIPPTKGEFVEIQLKTNLISLAAQLVEKQQPDVAKMIRSVELIRVNVIGLNDDNRSELTERVQKIQHNLDGNGWESNVNVQSKNGEAVRVFTRTRGGEALAGLVVTVMDEEHLVLVNIVGDIKPSQVAALGESLNIEPLKAAGNAIPK